MLTNDNNCHQPIPGDLSHPAATVIRILIPYEIPSQNVRERQHWRSRGKDRDRAIWLLRNEVARCPRLAHRGQAVKATLTSYRRQRIADDANLRGGAKGLVDAMVRVGILVDDSDDWCSLVYKQGTLAMLPAWVRERVPCTLIEVEAPL